MTLARQSQLDDQDAAVTQQRACAFQGGGQFAQAEAARNEQQIAAIVGAAASGLARALHRFEPMPAEGDEHVQPGSGGEAEPTMACCPCKLGRQLDHLLGRRKGGGLHFP